MVLSESGLLDLQEPLITSSEKKEVIEQVLITVPAALPTHNHHRHGEDLTKDGCLNPGFFMIQSNGTRLLYTCHYFGFKDTDLGKKVLVDMHVERACKSDVGPSEISKLKIEKSQDQNQAKYHMALEQKSLHDIESKPHSVIFPGELYLLPNGTKYLIIASAGACVRLTPPK